MMNNNKFHISFNIFLIILFKINRQYIFICQLINRCYVLSICIFVSFLICLLLTS